MPTTRRQSAGPSTSASSSASATKPPSSRSTRQSLPHPSTDATHPSVYGHHRSANEIMLDEAEQILHPSGPASGSSSHHHHQTADELAAAEAEEMLAQSPGLRSGRLRDGTPRLKSASVAGRRTSRGRGRESVGSVKGDDSEEEEEQEEAQTSAILQTELNTPLLPETDTFGGDEDDEESRPGTEFAKKDADDVTPRRGSTEVEEEVEDRGSSAEPLEFSARSSPAKHPEVLSARSPRAALPPSRAAASSSSGSSSGDTSESDSNGSSASDSSSESDSDSDGSETEDEDAEEERLDRLLAAAKLSANAAAASGAAGSLGAVQSFGDEDMLRLDAEEDEQAADQPIPQMSIPGMPVPSLIFNSNGTAKAGPSRTVKKLSPTNPVGEGRQKSGESSRSAETPRAVELDNREYERPLTKREKANRPKKATPSELWSTLPSARADMLPQMKRDYQALALANSMDPKRFMKGGQKVGKVPESFAIGTIVEQPRHLQASTMTREQKYRPGQLVQNVVEDAGVGEYAKRKFGDLQWKRMENGRGKGWKKRAKW